MSKATIVCQGIERAGGHTESCHNSLVLTTAFMSDSIGYGQVVQRQIILHGWQRSERGDYCARHRTINAVGGAYGRVPLPAYRAS